MKQIYSKIILCLLIIFCLLTGIVFLFLNNKTKSSGSDKKKQTAVESTTFSKHNTVSSHNSSNSNSSSGDTDTAPDFYIEEKILFIEKGDSYQLSVSDMPAGTNRNDFIWSSDNQTSVTVNNQGIVHTRKNGSAVITCRLKNTEKKVYINVIGSKAYKGKSCDFSILTSEGKERTYRLFKQNAHNYSKYDKYIAWHGCATCSLATVLGAYHSSYEGITPDRIITGPEKAVADISDWNREHKERSLKNQMPISLFGISAILNHYKVNNTYVRTYGEKKAEEDILAHLKTGNPIVFEVRQKSNLTGEKSNRWTNSYHTMVLLGALTNGKVLLCDSIDRSWYDEGQRLKIVDLSDIMEFMFPCTEFSESIYYDGAASDGGYIKIFGEDDPTP